MAHPQLEASSEIRLLYFHPGLRADDLECDIRVVSLTCLREGIPYAAVSYAWEDGAWFPEDNLEIKDIIWCKGDPLTISASLGRALQNLRDEDDLSPLWVDKICIDQSDNLEREQQIRHMGCIYGNAERVAVWLGDSNGYTKSVWKLLHKARLFLPYRPFQTHNLAFRSK